MKNHQLKALVQVAESGSIRAAARVMNLCQSALTKSLRELEEEVGVELLQPFQDQASGQWLLLNRGWLPWPDRRTQIGRASCRERVSSPV